MVGSPPKNQTPPRGGGAKPRASPKQRQPGRRRETLVKQLYSSYAGSQTARSDPKPEKKGKAKRRLQAWQVYLLVGVLAIGGYFFLPSQSAQEKDVLNTLP